MNYIKEALQKLNEMAKSKKEIRDDIVQKEEQRLQNLVLIFIFRDSSTVRHWIDELYASCSKTSKWDNTNKWMEEEMLQSFLISPWEDSFLETASAYVENARIHEQRNSKNEVIVGNYTPNNLHDFIVEYHLWLAKELSKNGKIVIDDTRNKIQELLDKYPKYVEITK